MKLKNNSKNSFIDVQGRTKYILAVGGIADIPDDVAKTWLKYDGVEEYISPEDIKKLKEEVAKTKKKK